MPWHFTLRGGRPRDRRRPSSAWPLLAPPVGGAERRFLFLPRARGRNEDGMLDAGPHGRIDGSDILRPAPSGRIDGRDDEQAIETRIGLRKTFGPVVVPESSLSRSRDGFGRARDSHYLVPARTPQQFRNDGPAQMAAGATHPDFHVNLQMWDRLVRPVAASAPATTRQRPI